MLAVTLDDALRDWRSGRAFWRNGRFWLKPLTRRDDGTIYLEHGRARVAPWNKLLKQAFPDVDLCDAIHEAGRRRWPPEAPRSEFELMHGIDPVKTRLLAECRDYDTHTGEKQHGREIRQPNRASNPRDSG